ncbi:MAG: EAL domain-containing protein [Pseudomonadota bacterium]
MLTNHAAQKHSVTAISSPGDVLAQVRSKLAALERETLPALLAEQGILGGLSEHLLAMHGRGYSVQQMAGLLKQCNIHTSEDVLRAFLHKHWILRISSCEQQIAEYHRPEWLGHVERHTLIEQGLRKALDEGKGLVLHYQPQVDIGSGKLLGAEALLRWETNGQLVGPTEFIPVAEASGLIVDIGEWVLREACSEAKRWQESGLGNGEGIKIGVNLSVKQFSDNLPDAVHGILCDTGLPTSLLGLEITESFLADMHSLELLRTLRNTGIHLSIDDFGTGYSCLSQLGNLPLDTIKIDRSFVTELDRRAGHSPVVEAIINIADKLGMTTLAEGVETTSQATALMDMGCNVCQGYLFSKPLSSADFLRFAAREFSTDTRMAM